MVNNYFEQISKLKQEKKYDEAIEVAKKAFCATNDNCYNNEIYECYVAQRNCRGAIDILKKMIEIEPKSLFLYKRLAYSYFCISEFKEALKYYKYILDREPASSNNNFCVGNMYHYLKDYKRALQYYDIAKKINPRSISVIDNIAVVYLETGKWERALPFLDYAIKIAPNSPEAYHHYGVIHRDYKNDLELSEFYLLKAARLDPKYPENYYQLALTYVKQGKLVDAMINIGKCLECNPNHKKSKMLMKLLKEKTTKA